MKRIRIYDPDGHYIGTVGIDESGRIEHIADVNSISDMEYSEMETVIGNGDVSGSTCSGYTWEVE